MTPQLAANFFDELGPADAIDLVRATERHETLVEVRELYDAGRTLRQVCVSSPAFKRKLEQLILEASSDLEVVKGRVQRVGGRHQ